MSVNSSGESAARELTAWRHKENSMTTKPEGPVQEPQAVVCASCGTRLNVNGYTGGQDEGIDSQSDPPPCGCRFCWHCSDNRGRHEEHVHPAPSQPMSAVRMDEMGVDDVAIDATMFRFERMDEQTFWLCAYRGDKRTTFTMWTQGGKLYCRRDDDELGTMDDSENQSYRSHSSMGNYYTDPDGRMKPASTPAPSQPAAREPWMEAAMEEIALLYIRSVVTKEQVDGVAVIARHYAQQTAAKDAEIADANQRVDFQRSQILDLDAAVERQTAIMQAAERERDSLREANARLAADLDAALKAGKDGQK